MAAYGWNALALSPVWEVEGVVNPYYNTERVTLYHGDCREILPHIGKVDAVVTDPPYGIGYRHSGGGNGMHSRRNSIDIHGDQADFDPVAFVSTPCVIWGANHFASRLTKGGTWLVWDKSCGLGPADSFTDAEFAWCSQSGVKRNVFRYLWKGVCTVKDEGSYIERLHPTQKPVALMRWCIDCLALERGAAILDPFTGSGTTAVACIETGRRFIGIEIEQKYCDIAVQRIETALEKAKQMELI